MSAFKEHREVIGLAQCTMPPRRGDAPLFREPWHARIFAVMVALVQERRCEWKTFQRRLTAELAEHQAVEASLSPEGIDLQYFDCWLHAAEDTLIDGGFLDEADISGQIEVIRATIKEIRDIQLGHHHH